MQNCITITSPNLVWEQHDISIEFELRLKNREMCSSCIDSCWLALVFGMGLPQIIAIRKYLVDTMRNCVIILLRSPDVMCKYDLIKSPNNNKHCGNMYIMCGKRHITVWLTRSSSVVISVTVKPRFPKKSRKAGTFYFLVIVHSTLFIHDANFCYSLGSQMPVNVNALLPLRHDWTSAPEKLSFLPERDVIGHDLVSYLTWRRPICELKYFKTWKRSFVRWWHVHAFEQKMIYRWFQTL